MAVLGLRERLAALPEQLQDDIRNHVFTPCTKTVAIDESYKAPAQLQVSHTTREHAADAYYRNTTFQIVQGFEDMWLGKWLPSLSKAHLALIHNFYYDPTPKKLARSRKSALSSAFMEIEPLWVLATIDGHFVQPQDIFINVKYAGADGIVREAMMDGDSIAEEWLKPARVYNSTRRVIRSAGKSDKNGKGTGEKHVMEEDGTQKNKNKKRKPKKKSNKAESEPVEEKENDEKVPKTRFASKNFFASLESWRSPM